MNRIYENSLTRRIAELSLNATDYEFFFNINYTVRQEAVAESEMMEIEYDHEQALETDFEKLMSHCVVQKRAIKARKAAMRSTETHINASCGKYYMKRQLD